MVGSLFGLASFKRTFEHVRQKESAPLKLAQNGLGGLPWRRDSNCFEQSAGFPLELPGIEEVSLGKWGDASKQQRANVNGPVSCCPLQAQKPSRNMFGGCGLTAAVASQQICGHNLLERIVVQRSMECKSGRRRSKLPSGIKQPRAHYLQIDDDGCAPGMVNWVFGVAQPPSLADTCTFSYKHELPAKVALREDFLRKRFGKLRRKRQHRLGVWT